MKVSKIIHPLLFAALTSVAPAAAIVVNEVYGGGGNSGAPYNQDYVELFNNSAASIDISGYQVQYASATGSFTNVVGTIPASTSLGAGALYLISTGPASGTVGAPLPTPNQVGGSINLSATTGKVRITLSDLTTVVDLVGYGTGNAFETAVAAGPSNSTSLQRFPNGGDTDNNAADFVVASPSPGVVNVPEPSTATALIGGLGLLCGLRRIRDRRSAARL